MPYKKSKNPNKPPKSQQDPMETQPQDPPPPPPPENYPQALRRKSKKKPLSKRQMALVQQKLSLLSQNLRPLPWAPPSPKTLESVSAHEPLFRSLGLWDFANLRLDGDPLLRRDLLVELIAHYDPAKHHSLVRGLRLKLSRADLGRALSLPKFSTGGTDFDATGFGGTGNVQAVLWAFISDRMVFFDDDTAIVPPEVVAAEALLKEGRPNRVDWAGLMWTLVEREIFAAPENGSCYYASHLQCLMKYQKPRLFEVTGHEEEPEQSEAATLTVDEDDAEGEEVGDVGSDKCGPGLSLGIGEDEGDGIKKCKEEEDMDVEHCLLECGDLSKEEQCEGERMEGVEHDDAGASTSKDLSKEEPDGVKCPDLIEEEPNIGQRVESNQPSKAEEDKGKMVDNGFNEELAAAKFPTLERLTSSDFMQVMGTGNNVSFGIEQSSGEFLAVGSDMHNKSMGLDMGPGSSSLFGNDRKRGVNEIDDQVNEFNLSQHQQKRFRSNQHWEDTPAVTGFEGCMEQVQQVMGKAHMDLVEKERTYMDIQTEIQYVSEALHQKDLIIQALEKTGMEQKRKRGIESARFNHDVKTLSNIVSGCKRALKDTQNAFAEYKRRFPMDDEPLHGVGGATGGDVVAKQMTKPCSIKEEEMCKIARGMIDTFYKSWSGKLIKYATQVSQSAAKLVHLKDDIKFLKEKLGTIKSQSHI